MRLQAGAGSAEFQGQFLLLGGGQMTQGAPPCATSPHAESRTGVLHEEQVQLTAGWFSGALFGYVSEKWLLGFESLP